ncbi:MAG: 16S rRNA (guanine(966)-N(2))-methyltransferase RsmD [Clostridia bacterium]|nr:16S rRNA (guanine(966)-N(2))-methyltransferase RsmD [Clostridia bacterium]
MRVITGSARGRKLVTPDGMEVRPTLDKVKEGLFSAIQFEIEGRDVLDLFAGSGQLGVEALSRGASSCVFVDSSKKSVHAVTTNVSACGFQNQSKVLTGDALSYIKSCMQTFGIVFLDPPYGMKWIDKVLPFVVDHVEQGGIIVCETDLKEELPEECGDFCVDRVRNYSHTKVTIYRRKQSE